MNKPGFFIDSKRDRNNCKLEAGAICSSTNDTSQSHGGIYSDVQIDIVTSGNLQMCSQFTCVHMLYQLESSNYVAIPKKSWM